MVEDFITLADYEWRHNHFRDYYLCVFTLYRATRICSLRIMCFRDLDPHIYSETCLISNVFRHLHLSEVCILFPSDWLLKASDHIWTKDFRIKCLDRSLLTFTDKSLVVLRKFRFAFWLSASLQFSITIFQQRVYQIYFKVFVHLNNTSTSYSWPQK